MARRIKVNGEMVVASRRVRVNGDFGKVYTDGNLFFGKELYAPNPDNPAKIWTDNNPNHSYSNLIKQKIAGEPSAQWAYATIMGGQNAYDWANQRKTAHGNKIGLIVLYNIPQRDLGSYSAGGASSASVYTQWITDIIAGLDGRPTPILYEPDALPMSTGMDSAGKSERYALMKDSIARLTAAGHSVYVDAGGPRWKSVTDIVNLLHLVDAENARGFSINVSNFVPTPECQTYAEQVSAAFGGSNPLRFIIDTSRNGNSSYDGSDVFNPPNRALGARQGSSPTSSLGDAYVWIKVPGESDGNDGSVEFDGSVAPNSGTFWPAYAYKLAERADWSNSYTIQDTQTGTGNYQLNFSAGWSVSALDHYTQTLGSQVSTSIKCMRVRLYGTREPNAGVASLTFDGAISAIDMYAATRTENILLWDSGNLSDTTHTFTLANNGAKRAEATGYYINIDRLVLDIVGALPVVTSSTPTTTTRDVVLHPYRGSWTSGAPAGTFSVWNTPIGSGAALTATNFPAQNGSGGKITRDPIHIGYPTDAQKTLTSADPRAPWPGGYTQQVRVKAGDTAPGDYSKGNSICALILADDPTRFWQGHPLLLTDGGNPHITGYIDPHAAPDDLYGTGSYGAHGGSHMSGLACVRQWEWDSPNEDAIQHAIPININGPLMSYTNIAGQNGGTGYRYPANSADSGAPTNYTGTNDKIKMGTLLTLPANYNWQAIADLNARKIVRAMWAFGMYVVDDSAWEVYQLSIENTINWGANDTNVAGFHTPIMDAIRASVVVDNNSATSVGGGGTPRTALVSDVSRPSSSLTPLPYAPAEVTYTTVHINGGSGVMSGAVRTLTLTAGVDYHIIFDEPITHRLRIVNGRHLKIVGGEFDINVENAPTGSTTASAYDVDCALEIWGQTGTVHIEGLLVHGAYALDSIRSGGATNSDVQVQNCRLISDRILQGVTGPSDGVFHSDGLQFWDGIRSLKVYNVTICNPYQGGMFGDGDLTAGIWGNTSVKRTNYRPGPTVGQAWKIINFTGDGSAPTNLQGPFTFEDVYYQKGANVTWSNNVLGTAGSSFSGSAFYSHMNIGTDAEGRQYGELDTTKVPNSNIQGYSGRFYEGLPPDGDFCPAGVAGMSYISPGYIFSENFNGTYSLTTTNNGTHPHLWIEHSGLNITPIVESGGVAKLTNNTHTNTYQGYHRMFSRQKFDISTGKSIRFRYRARATSFSASTFNNTVAGVNIGFKWPQEQSVSGWPKDDPRSVIGGDGDTVGPMTMIFRTGFNPNGVVENTVYNGTEYIDYGNRKTVPYTAGTWRDVVVRVDPILASNQVRIRYWHNSSGSGTPIYDYVAPTPGTWAAMGSGFIWYRTDFANFEYDYMIVEEV